MLSKPMPPGVVEKRSSYRTSRRKENFESRKSSDTSPVNEERDKESERSMVKPCLNSNWERFRSVVSQQDSTQKKTKRSHSHPGKSWRANHKSPRMLPPRVENTAENGERVSGNKEESSQENELTKQIAMDCEMVGIGDGTESMLARVSLVNRHGICIYDKYVKPRETIQDYRTAVSGIRPHHLAGGEEFEVVQSEVSEILRGRILIGHALKNDLSVLFLSHPKRNLRDTSRYKPFRKVVMGNTPSLKKLAAELLGVDIQTGEHNSIEDARAAMQLYVLYKIQWERDVHK